jgi:hypothetical protein
MIDLDAIGARAAKVPEGCGDHSCIIRTPKGMATNGGCRCPDVLLRRAVRVYRASAADVPGLVEEVQRLRAALAGSPP